MHRILGLIVAAVVAGCSTNPYTGRSQLILVSEAQEMVQSALRPTDRVRG